jgi:hypothetical protein
MKDDHRLALRLAAGFPVEAIAIPHVEQITVIGFNFRVNC